MKAFEVLRYWVCSISGEVMVQFTLQISKEEMALEKFFPNAAFADAYLSKHKRDWFLMVLEDWVNHKKHIIDAGGHEGKRAALNTCIAALDAYNKMETTKACSKFLGGINWFEKILPDANNNSYQSSVNNLSEIKKFCELETKPAHGKKEQ